MKTRTLLLIKAEDSVDEVLILQPENKTELDCIREVVEYADFRGEAYVAERIPYNGLELDTFRPFVG